MKKIKNLTKRLLISVLTIASLATAIFGFAHMAEGNTAAHAAENSAIGQNADEDFVYLSDYDYVKELNGKKMSYSTYDPYHNTGAEIVLNGCAIKSNADGMISLAIGGRDEDGFPKTKKYLKGMTACAPSEVVYDISGFDYDRFSTYYGIDSKVAYVEYMDAPQDSGKAKFYFYTSVDGENWNLQSDESPTCLAGQDVQSFIQ